MHSKKVSIIIGLIIFAANLVLAAVYLQKQGEHTFGFMKSLYEEIRAYRADGESLAFLSMKHSNYECDAANEKH
jgi:hypothetical protein